MQRRELLKGVGTALMLPSAVGIFSAVQRLSAAPKFSSEVAGVQVGVISYSFRSMADQSAEAILRYCLDSGISAIELMGDPAEWFAGMPFRFDMARMRRAMMRTPPGAPPLTPEEQKENDALRASFAEYQRNCAEWRASASMQRFAELRREFNSAGVSIYAFKPSTFESANSDAEVDYGMRAARALGADHVTVELPSDIAQVKRLGATAQKYGLRVGYHQHLQARPDLWDAALAASPATAINLDLGHYTAAGDYDGMAFIQKYHDRISSLHLKDRKTRAHGQANLPWGEGDTPLASALRLMRDQHYRFPATIELEYDIPAGSDAVKEVARCLEYCRRVLTKNS